MKQTFIFIACTVAAYLIGSVNPSIIISNGLMNKDIRKYGSGNAGTTNMMRVFGWQFGLITFVCDVIKGVIAVYTARFLGGDIVGLAASIAVVSGHNWPVYYNFKGGKGVATTFGVLLVWQPLCTVCIFIGAILIILITRIVSISSILGCIFSLIAAYLFYPSGPFLLQRITVTILSAFSIYQHRANIKRLLKGQENKLSFRSSAYIIKEIPKDDKK